MTDTPTAYSMQFTWPTPTTTKVPEIIDRMDSIAKSLMEYGVMNLGMSLKAQIDELREILGVRP